MIEYRCAQSSVKSKIDLTRFFPVEGRVMNYITLAC